MSLIERIRAVAGLALAMVAGISVILPGHASAQPGAVYYQCPGNVFTNTISAKEADARHCTAKEAKEPTTIAAPKIRAAPPGASGLSTARVDPASQRARDSDARRILETELKSEEERLTDMQKEYNNGEPERQGNERNYQKYVDRVADMKAAIARKESDIAAIRRELAKTPQ